METVELTTAATPRPSPLDWLKAVVSVPGLVIAPLLALLPARLGYWIACRRADWVFRHSPERPATVKRNLLQVFGDTLSPAEAEGLAREYSRVEFCDVIDVMRLRNGGRPLRKLVEFRGREHLEAAMAGGKGAILCSAHFGSYRSAFSLIHASGIPVTSIGRWWWNYNPNAPAVRLLWDHLYARRLLRYRQGPNIEPWTGRLASGVQAVRTLRRNEVVTILADAPPLVSDASRVVTVPYLGREGTLLPGVVHLARSSGAPVLMVSVHRSADYRHQVVEISPPVSMDGEPQEALARCTAMMDATIRTNLAHWQHWAETDFLADLGLIPRASSPLSAIVA